jgi:hypothetical protein
MTCEPCQKPTVWRYSISLAGSKGLEAACHIVKEPSSSTFTAQIGQPVGH